jgi:hypothetical protein
LPTYPFPHTITRKTTVATATHFKEIAMGILLPLEKMSKEDKIYAMETIWDNLCQKAESIPSPSWHKDISVPYGFETAIKNKLFCCHSRNSFIEAVSKAFYNVWFFYWVMGKAHCGQEF